ncbi:MAG: DUF58 domain-containing protein [Planctomycetaceae bacterium]|nr:DUF58 domain-containing protein [Planctomycetaceae bacterium]
MVFQDSQELKRYLDPKVLSKITRLDLQARLVVEGFISGLHRSPFHGYSVEFASHRQYVPGDDTKHIDWKVQAKTDRYYIKQYEEETNLKATFVLDASESMHYGSENGDGGMTKYQYAAAVAASLAFLLLQQQDSTGLAIFDEDLRQYLPASGSVNQIKSIVHAMDITKPKAKTSIEDICHSLAEKIPRRGLVCLVSDLFCDIEGVVRGLEHFRHYDHEVLVLHIMDQDELDFPFQGNTMFRGLEAMGDLLVEPRALREGYLKAVEEFCLQVKRRCIARRIDYKRISTADHMDAALLAFLAARTAATRKAGAKR